MQNVQVLLQPTEIDDPGGVRRLAPGRQRRGEDLERLEDLDLRLLVATRARSSSTGSEPMLWVPKTTSTHGAFSMIVAAVLLREAAADGDLHARARGLHGREVAEVAVQLVVGVLAHRAGVEDDDVGRRSPSGARDVARRPPAAR